MSSHSPTIVTGVSGLVDTSAMFGKSILDTGVPYPADMAGLPTSTPNPGPLKRKTRRSWFETTPSGTKIEIAVEKPQPAKKILSGEREVLTLTHFTAAPRLDFGTMKPGQTKVCTLLLRNPHEYAQTVKVERVPEKKNFTVAQKTVTVESGECFPLEVTWSPPEPGNFREMILMQVDKAYRLQAYVFGTVTAPPQKKKKRRVGLLATKVSKPFSVIQTSGLASINHEYSPDKNRRSGGTVQRSSGTTQVSVDTKPKMGKTTRRSGETGRASGETRKRSGESGRASGETRRRSGETRRSSGETARRSSRLSGQGLQTKHENVTKVNTKNNLNKAKARDNNKENVENKIPKKKMRRSNTYSNVPNQGLLIPVIHGDTVQGQMDTSLIEIIDKCNMSGMEPLEQSFRSPESKKYAEVNPVLEKPSFLEEKNGMTPNLDKIVSQIIPIEDKNNEPSFLDVAEEKTGRAQNVKLQTLKSNDAYDDSLESEIVSKEVPEYVEQPSFLSPHDVGLRRSTRRSGGKSADQFAEPTEVKLLKSLKRRSGRRSITKEKRRSSQNKSAGSKSILEQLKNLRTFIKEKSFEIESGDEPSFLKSDHNLTAPVVRKEASFLTESPHVEKPALETELRRETYLAETFKIKDAGQEEIRRDLANTYRIKDAGQEELRRDLADTYRVKDAGPEEEVRRDTFLADPSKIKLLETQKPSEASPRRTTFTVLRKTHNLKSPARSKSEGSKPQHVLAALDEALNEAEETSKDSSGADRLVEGPVGNEVMEVVKQTEGARRVSESPKRLFSADSLENDSFEPMFTSPKQIKLENAEEFERRTTLTVTKSRPSDALLDQMKRQTACLFKAEDTFETTHKKETEVVEMMNPAATTTVTNTCPNSTFERSENKDPTNTSEISFPSTPHQLPTSPNPDHSRRSTHIVKEPRLVNLKAIEQRELFQESLDDSNKENQVPEVTLENLCESNKANQQSDSPANNTRRRLSARRSLTNLKSDSIENSANVQTQKRDSIKHRDSSSGVKTSKLDDAKELNQASEIQAPEMEKDSDEVEGKSEKIDNHGLLFIPFDVKNEVCEGQKAASRPKTTVDPKQFLKKRGNPVPVAMTMDRPKRVKKESVNAPKSSGAVSAGVAKNPGPVNTDAVKKFVPAVNVKKPSREIQAAVKEAKTGLNNRTVVKQKTTSVKGLAQSKLILLKKSKTALPKHPMPFAAKNMYYDERWMEKQERGFVNWLNFILTPAEEYQGNDVKVKVDAGKLTVDVAKGSVKLAPTNEVLSFRAYSAHRKLNRLRKSACRLFQSESVVKVIQKLEGEVESGRLVVRKDKMLHADIGLKQKILDTLLCYNPLWLRVGIETIYGEIVPLQSNSDVFGLSRFILTRLLTSPDVNQEFAHPTVPHLYKNGYAEATAVHSLKKFLMLVYFLDRAKQERLIDHNPCLFCKNSDVKASKDVLQHFSRDYLSGEGDIIRHLGYLGYKVTYAQTALDEFDFAVSKLSTDLRDGLRLTKVFELMCNKPDLSRTLRVPAISRLQKVHNVEVVFKTLTEENIQTDGVVSRDIVDGHRERTLRLLWNIILHYQVEILLNEAQLREEIDILERSLKVKTRLQKFLKYSNNDKSKRESEGPDLHTQNPRLNLLLKWCRAVCAFSDIKVENFTVSFSDGRALCHIVNYYHPGLLPLDMIRTETSMTHMESLERNTNRSMTSSLNDSFNTSAVFGGTEDPVVYERLLNNEKENFRILFEKVKELGGIPLMLKWSDMSNTIPDEKVVVTYLLYLCARLLDIRHESRAARVIQLAWRKYRLKSAEAEYELKNKAAFTIQKHVKEFLARRRTERLGEAALLLQRVWRGYLARKRVRQLKLDQVMRKQIQAVQTLQRAVMGYLYRRRYLQMKAAVTQVQAHCRGYLVRKRRNDAARVIQSALRCYVARKHLDNILSSVVKIQSCVRGYITRRRVNRYKQAVITLQRRLRANLIMKEIRREFECKKRSCILIQKCWRNYQTKKVQKEVDSAVKIQKLFRGYLERRRYLRLKSCVLVLQAAIRGCIQRKNFMCQKQAATTIQSYFRNCLLAKHQRAEFQKLRQTAVFLQAQRRMILEKRRYDADIQSVIRVQSTVRMFLERRRFLKFREAVLTIQRNCQVYACRRQYKISVGATITLQAGLRGYIVRKELRNHHRAATVLQAFIRMTIERRKYLVLKTVVIQCQRRVRANIAGSEQLQEYRSLQQAALTTQKLFRGRLCRQQYLKDRESIVKAQGIVRTVLARRFYTKLRNAAVLIQRQYRAKKLGEKCRFDLQRMSLAATVIQSWYRGYTVRMEIQRQHAAATLIQSHIKCMLKKQEYARIKMSVVLCQQRVRAKLAVKRQMTLFRNLRTAAIVIQRFVRGWKCRRSYHASCRQIIKTQAVCKMFIERRRFLKQKDAVLVLQRRFRAKQLGLVYKARYNCTKQAAITLQAAYRGLKVRREVHKQRSAAILIQKNVKKYYQRKMFLEKKTAVVVLQRRFRAKLLANMCRQKYNTTKQAAITVQAAFRGFQARKNLHIQHTAAICIQRHVKGYLQRNQFLKTKDATLVLQRRFRAKQLANMCRRRYNITKQAAITLQAAFRGFISRRNLHRQHTAAICIQKYVKGCFQRKEFLKMKESALVLQRRFRSKQLANMCRQKYNITKQAAITLQAAFRGFISRRNLHRQHTAAICIQKYVKGCFQRKQFLKKKDAALILQRQFRAKQLSNMCRQRYNITKQAAITLQAAFRGFISRRNLHRQHTAAICIQKYVKGYCQRKQFSLMKTSVITLQRIYRAKREGNRCRCQYLEQKSAAIVIQSFYRGFHVRRDIQHKNAAATKIQAAFKRYCQQSKFLKLKAAVGICQSRYRAKLLRRRVQGEFATMKSGITKLQALVRGRICRYMYRRTCSARMIQSVFRMYKCRKEYQRVRCDIIHCQAAVRGYLTRRMFTKTKRQLSAACVLQTRWRAMVQGRIDRKAFIDLRMSVMVIQKHFRAKLTADQARRNFIAKKQAVIVIQSAIRRFLQRRHYLHQKQAAITIQSMYRGYMCRKFYLNLRTAVVTCQNIYRAKLEGHKERQNYLTMRNSAVKIQSTYRAFACRKRYENFKMAAIRIQSFYRGYKAVKAYRRVCKATIVLQTSWRAELLCRRQWLKYHSLRDAALLVQRNYRATIVRANYLKMRQAAITIQANIRMWRARQQLYALRQQREMVRGAFLDRVVRVTQVHLAAVRIQRFYRNYRVMKVANEQLHSVTLIQKWMRSKLQRISYIRDRSKIISLQRRVRDWLVKRHTAASVIQRAVRRWKSTFEERKKERAAKKIQALWRGYQIRRNSKSKKLATARKRVMEANASATEEKKLCNRTTSALDFLLKYKQLSYVLDALQHLEVATRLSWSCCEKMVEANAVTVLYRLLRSCNRSLPHMEIVKLTVDILLNLAKYEKTRTSLYTEEECFPALVELMQIYREKQGTIFIKTCTLLGIMSMDPPCKTAILKDKKLTEKLQSFQKLTARKQKLEETQRVTRAKMNATFNSTFVVRSPVKKHRIKPDWALHKDKMKDIESPLKAINFVLINLGLAIK